MHKAIAQAEQFYSRSGSESTKGSRKGFSLLGGGEDVLAHLTPEEQRDSLKRRLAYLRGLRADGHVGKAIGLEIAEVNQKLHDLRPRIKSSDPQAIPNLFMDVCREMMTKPQFNAILAEANRRQRAAASQESGARLAATGQAPDQNNT